MPNRREQKSDRPRGQGKKASNRYTADEILTLLHQQPTPPGWAELVALCAADSPRSITQLRQMLKGLERNQQISRDHQGNYLLCGAQEVQQLLVQRQGKALAVDGRLIADPQRYFLREGDLVEVTIAADRVSVLRVLEHSAEPVVGVLHWQGRTAFVDGLGVFRGRVRLLEPPQDAQHGDSVAVRIVDRDRRGLLGVISDYLRGENILDQAIQTAIASGEIPHSWPQQVDSAVARLPQRVDPHRYPHRLDLTTTPLVTIDGASAKDFDDAVFAEPMGGGQMRLLVAIADVAHYVKTNSALDNEAVQRGTSVYFPQRVIPMLPEAISNDLCSLMPDTPRLTLVCEMVISRAGEVHKHNFHEAVIHSRGRLTYHQVQTYLDGDLPANKLPVASAWLDGVCGCLHNLQKVYHRLRKRREKRGALDFATREGELRLDKKGAVKEIVPVERNLAHQLIEEAMIAANVCAAEFLEAHHQPSLYRVHEPPDVEKLEELRQALALAGVRLPTGVLDPAAIQHALSNLPDTANGWLYAQLALRSLQQAIYTPNNKHHFGLALQRYMHFTSPIRRYPDLLVHRAIKSVLAGQPGSSRKNFRPPTADRLHWLGEECSRHERRAESAGWLVDGWLKCDFLRRELGNTLPGIIAGVTEFGLFVELEGYFIQGLLHISSLGSDYFNFHARSLALVGERSGRRFRLGDQLRVVITDIEPAQGRINLQLAAGGGNPQGNKKGKKERQKKAHRG